MIIEKFSKLEQLHETVLLNFESRFILEKNYELTSLT